MVVADLVEWRQTAIADHKARAPFSPQETLEQLHAYLRLTHPILLQLYRLLIWEHQREVEQISQRLAQEHLRRSYADLQEA